MEHGRGAVDLLRAVRAVAETGSTNADMIALAAAGAEEGCWVRAERQTAGRGRQGRAWVSPPGNLYASTAVRWREGDPPAATLALVAGVALGEAVLSLVRQLHPSGDVSPAGLADSQAPKPNPRSREDDGLVLKWPNDLLLGGAKVSGILLERAGDAVVLGFGINLAHHPDLPERPTTSLAAHRVVVSPEQAFDALQARLAAWIVRWRAAGLAPVRERWLELAHPCGTPLTARLPDGTSIDGAFAGLGADGALLLGLADGSTRAIHAGDVFLL